MAELLSRRETQCLDLLAQGHPRREIADILDISYGTVQTHMVNVYAKLEVSNATGAVWEGMRLGLIDPPEVETRR